MTRPPHPRWTDWADAIIPAPRDLPELIDLVQPLRDEIQTGVRDATAPFARHLAESANRLGYRRAGSALARAAAALGAGRPATADVVAALRSLQSPGPPPR